MIIPNGVRPPEHPDGAGADVGAGPGAVVGAGALPQIDEVSPH